MTKKQCIAKFKALVSKKDRLRKRFSRAQSDILSLAKKITNLEAQHQTAMVRAQSEVDAMHAVELKIMELPDDVLRNFGIWRDRSPK